MENAPMELATYPLKSPRRGDAWWWRLFATGASFAGFGVGALLLQWLVLPLLMLLPGDALAKRRRARATVSRAFHLQVQFMYRTRAMDFHIDGAERLGRPGQMIVANHPSLIDVVLLIAQLRDSNCIVKADIARNPFTRRAMRATQYIVNDGAPDMLDHAADALREGQSLVVFPEGTRTTPGCAPVFHRGAAAIAVRGARVITPVFISVTPTTLTKAEPWYHITDRRVRFLLRVGADIDPAQFNANTPLPIASRRLNAHLHQLFMKELTSP